MDLGLPEPEEEGGAEVEGDSALGREAFEVEAGDKERVSSLGEEVDEGLGGPRWKREGIRARRGRAGGWTLGERWSSKETLRFRAKEVSQRGVVSFGKKEKKSSFFGLLNTLLPFYLQLLFETSLYLRFSKICLVSPSPSFHSPAQPDRPNASPPPPPLLPSSSFPPSSLYPTSASASLLLTSLAPLSLSLSPELKRANLIAQKQEKIGRASCRERV